MKHRRLVFPLALALAAALALPPGAAHARKLFETNFRVGGNPLAYDGTNKLRNVSDLFDEDNLDATVPLFSLQGVDGVDAGAAPLILNLLGLGPEVLAVNVEDVCSKASQGLPELRARPQDHQIDPGQDERQDQESQTAFPGQAVLQHARGNLDGR